ncbi:MAG: hypothetical protein P4L46_10195 [Fimbriimonas sp.]|nr:hypothetical protein [Fimbriimonas sp.]
MLTPCLLSIPALMVHAALGFSESTIKWQGYTWNVRSAHAEGPGPNDWAPSNVWLDSKGDLHMKIDKVDGKWCCAEIWTDHPLGFGTYQCQVEGAIDKFDPNIVFSMFSYAGPDGTKEIDIEYARWGNPKFYNGSWTVYPNDSQGKKGTLGFDFHLHSRQSTSRFKWGSNGIDYWLQEGWKPVDSTADVLKDWRYHPADASHAITQNPIPLHFNLWLFEGKPPADGKPVEVVVHSFVKQ